MEYTDSSRAGSGALLATLVATADALGDATSLLDEGVVLHRLDGTHLEGRLAVVDAISTRGTEARFYVLARVDEAVRVALVVDGVPGRLEFVMTATVVAGRLREIWMD